MSAEITWQLEGIEELKTAMEKFDSNIQTEIHKQLAMWASNIEATAKQLVPVRTGYLQSTIHARISDWVADVGAEASYAAFVEFGTRHVQAHPYLRPAIKEHLPELEQTLLEAIDNAKAEAGLK
jgi:HK97 gp10 family phage protein